MICAIKVNQEVQLRPSTHGELGPVPESPNDLAEVDIRWVLRERSYAQLILPAEACPTTAFAVSANSSPENPNFICAAGLFATDHITRFRSSISCANFRAGRKIRFREKASFDAILTNQRLDNALCGRYRS